jgi:hypothetical protein
VSQASPDLAAALEAIERLTDALTDERRQLMAAAEDRRSAEREREEARIDAARLQAELDTFRDVADQQAAEVLAARDELRARLEEIAAAGSHPGTSAASQAALKKGRMSCASRVRI